MDSELRLRVLLRHGLFHEQLVRTLVGICGLHVDAELLEDGTTAALGIEGQVGAEDVALAADVMLPHLDELIDRAPAWCDDTRGIMQLIALVQVDHALRRRTWR